MAYGAVDVIHVNGAGFANVRANGNASDAKTKKGIVGESRKKYGRVPTGLPYRSFSALTASPLPLYLKVAAIEERQGR